MPKRANIYIAVVIGLAAVILAACLASGLTGSGAGRTGHGAERFAAYLALACITSTWKVKLPRVTGTMSVSFLLILISMAELSLQETLLIGCIATLVQCLWRPKKKPSARQVAFNVSAITLSTFAAGTTLHSVTGDPSHPAFLALAACIYFLTNTAVVTLVMALVDAKPFADKWNICYLWTLPYYIAGATIATFMSAASRTVGWRPALFSLLLMYMIYVYYRMFVNERSRQVSIG